MRSLWLVSLACLLVAAQAIQLPNIQEPEEDVLDELEEDEDVDMARMLGDLFEDEEIDEDDDDDEEVTGRQLAEVTVSEQARYNTFMDTVLAQLKRQVERNLEPLKFTLTKPKKDKKNGKKKQRKNKNRKDKKDDKEERKNKRNSKDIELPVFKDDEEDLHQIQKRQAETEDGFTDRMDTEEDEENENEKRTKKWRKNNRDKNNKTKNKNKNKNKKQKKSNNKVVLHGLSHIAREGDVKRYNMKKGTALLTEFVIGPVELDVTRKFDAEEHKAAASAEKLNGKILLKINKQGNPRVKKLVIGRPKDITTTGSTARGFGSGKGLFKKSVKQVSPTAAKKLLKAARSIIQNV